MSKEYVHTVLFEKFGSDVGKLIAKKFVDDEKIKYNRAMTILQLETRWGKSEIDKKYRGLNLNTLMDNVMDFKFMQGQYEFGDFIQSRCGVKYEGIYGVDISLMSYYPLDKHFSIIVTCATPKIFKEKKEFWMAFDADKWVNKIYNRIPFLKNGHRYKNCKNCHDLRYLVNVRCYVPMGDGHSLAWDAMIREGDDISNRKFEQLISDPFPDEATEDEDEEVPEI